MMSRAIRTTVLSLQLLVATQIGLLRTVVWPMTPFTFAIVGKADNPIYELVISPKKEEPTVNQQNQFFLHAVQSPRNTSRQQTEQN